MKATFQGAILAAAMLLPPLVTPAHAEVTELRMATQYGIGTLPMVIVQKKYWFASKFCRLWNYAALRPR